jgi:Fe2+ or Zn2+ uptake regulation protein
MGKSLQLPKTSLAQKQRQVAEILLEYGARPDAKDVCGKVRVAIERVDMGDRLYLTLTIPSFLPVFI